MNTFEAKIYTTYRIDTVIIKNTSKDIHEALELFMRSDAYKKFKKETKGTLVFSMSIKPI